MDANFTLLHIWCPIAHGLMIFLAKNFECKGGAETEPQEHESCPPPNAQMPEKVEQLVKEKLKLFDCCKKTFGVFTFLARIRKIIPMKFPKI